MKLINFSEQLKNPINTGYSVNNTLSEVGSDVLRTVLTNRGIQESSELSTALKDLIPVSALEGCQQAAEYLLDAQQKQQCITIVGDYDSDGATATAVAIKALTSFGFENVNYVVPNRFEYGYGLTPEIVELAAENKPDWIITVDNGISSHNGVDSANELGIKVIITDHHLQADTLPNAEVIINPNQKIDDFSSKALAGVGVIFYLMLALKKAFVDAGMIDASNVNLVELLDLVALGTVGDVVPLDKNNRILVENGLRRIRSGECCQGIQALFKVANRDISTATSTDLAFVCAPRVNAAGRLDDISIGIECLLSNTQKEAFELASILNDYNVERRAIEQDMQIEAEKLLKEFDLSEIENNDSKNALPSILCLYHPNWHQGVVGILASRIKEKTHRPVIAFAKVNDNEIKGSARSIKGIHIRDLLDEVAKKIPQQLSKFGGHAMAAGLSLDLSDFDAFNQTIIETLDNKIDESVLQRVCYTDGELASNQCDLQHALELRYAMPWGQLFPAPTFDNHFEIINKRILKDKHLKLVLRQVGSKNTINHQAIAFNVDLDLWPEVGENVHLLYRLEVNEFRGAQSPQLMIEYLIS